MPRKRVRKPPRSRVYWRTRRTGRRFAYGDFRDYADVGGGLEALIPQGEKVATTDADVADKLKVERLEELERARRNRSLLGTVGATLEDFASEHLEKKARSKRFTARHLRDLEGRLRDAVAFFGPDRVLDSIGVVDVTAWLDALAAKPSRTGGTLSDGTRRAYLNALSNLYARAISEGKVPRHYYNPARAVIDKPQPARGEARWLEVHDAALLLESARTWRPKRPDTATPGVYAVVATLLLTGGRKSEVLGLDVDDVSFDRRTIVFRPNRWRRLKTLTSRRVVPMWPQLEEVLRAHVFERDEPLSGLLFPAQAARFGPNAMVGDLDKALDEIAARCGWKPKEIRARAMRHTYTAARLQTLDHGAPVSPYTVAKELGHGGLRLVERVYGHLGDVRHRSPVVEYRVQNHEDVLGDRLAAMRAT